jgi:tetratricopeptide (TPR) repeat protein
MNDKESASEQLQTTAEIAEDKSSRSPLRSASPDKVARFIAICGLLLSTVTGTIAVLSFVAGRSEHLVTNRLAAKDLCDEALDLMGGNIRGTPWITLSRGAVSPEEMRLFAQAQRKLEKALEKAIEIAPDYYAPYELLGLYYLRFGNLEKAHEYLRRSVALAPEEEAAWPWSDLAQVLGGMGRNKEAEEAYRQAISLRPRFPVFHNNFSNFLRNIGRIDEADREYKLAQQLSNETGTPLELR